MTNTPHSNIGRIVEIGFGPAMKKGTVIAEQIKAVRGRERTFLTIRLPDGTCFEQDGRHTSFAWDFVPPSEAIAEMCLDQAINSRLGLK
jgi:hypothetical protein